VSRWAPTTWKAVDLLGPASRTQIRIRSPARAVSGRWSYWFGVAVEDHRVGVFRVDLVDVDGAALGAEVELGLEEDVLVCDRR